jgi:hypothetical protein
MTTTPRAVATEDVRGILSVGAMLGYFVLLGILIWCVALKLLTVQDLLTIAALVSPLPMIGFGFYFGQKSVNP